MTKGRRYMFVPFLQDEAAQRVREANAKYLSDSNQRDSDTVVDPALDARVPVPFQGSRSSAR